MRNGRKSIVTDPEILNGKPIVKGTRISVALILQRIASGMTKEEILGGYPTWTAQRLEAALDFAARQFQGEEVRFFENRITEEAKTLVSVRLNDGKKSPNYDSQKEDRGVLQKTPYPQVVFFRFLPPRRLSP